MENYNLKTATSASTFAVLAVLKDADLNSDNLKAAGIALKNAVDERIPGMNCSVDISRMEGRFIKVEVTDKSDSPKMKTAIEEYEV